jgi:prevent-host-death family protein
MQAWTLNDARNRFADILQYCASEPQIFYQHDQPVAVLVDIAFFEELMALKQPEQRLTIAELLAELSEIQTQEPVEFQIPARTDRSNPLVGATQLRDVMQRVCRESSQP